MCLAFVMTHGARHSEDARADERDKPPAAPQRVPKSDRSLLTADQWTRLDRAVDRGLAFIAKSQKPDRSFPAPIGGQPGVTSLCVMAFLARGHQPGKGPYGAQLDRAIDYVLDAQYPSSGAIMPERFNGAGDLGSGYSHAISGAMLAEVYGMTDSKRRERIRTAVVKALDYTRKLQVRPKRNPGERGGWRYIHKDSIDSDLSVTAWNLMFLRSARNAEFNVPQEWVDEAMGYVHRSFDANNRFFVYALTGGNRYTTRAMVGAGIVALALGGEHRSETARMAGDWILRSSFEPYNNFHNRADRYHYGAFYCSQAMFQLGGEYWQRFFPGLLRVLAEAQRSDGSWALDSIAEDAVYGSVYSTSLAVLALATPYQILPIYQR
jgi:hypothetical protein